MEVKIYNLAGESKDTITLPEQFLEPIRVDLIRRAFLAEMSRKRQPYGADPLAGKRKIVRLKRVRRNPYRAVAARGYAYKVPRMVMYRFGGGWGHVVLRGAFAPNTVGGRRAHPPKAEKVWEEDINKKEKRKAIRSALAATASRYFVEQRHKLPEELSLPVVTESSLEALTKTKEVLEFLNNLGLEEELQRCYYGEKKWRAGKGKRRGRRYITKKGPLIVVSQKDLPIFKAARNIPGVDVLSIDNLKITELAPGAFPGRLTIFTEPALKRLKEEKLYM
jgi:large subunit ribosomal protein L4e